MSSCIALKYDLPSKLLVKRPLPFVWGGMTDEQLHEPTNIDAADPWALKSNKRKHLDAHIPK